MFKKRYSDRYADCPGVGKITDEMVAKYVRNHTHWWDRLDYRKIIDAAQKSEAPCEKRVPYNRNPSIP